MVGRSLRLLLAPGVPFQPDPVQEAISSLRRKVHIQVYDCRSQQEAYDALGHFWPDCVVLDAKEQLDSLVLDNLLRRTNELAGEDQPMIYILNQEDLKLWSMPHVCVVPSSDMRADFLQDHFLLDARPKKRTNRFSPLPAKGQTYQWMGRTTYTEEGISDTFLGEERFKSLVHNSHDLVCVVEEDGFIKYASASAYRVLGRWPEELAGRFLLDILPACKQGSIARWFQKQKGQDGFSEIAMSHADGHQVVLEAACVDLTTDKAIKGYVITARDITSRLVAEEKLTYQGRLLAHIREAVIGLDTHGCVIYLNKAAERLYRVAGEDTLGKPWGEVCQTEWMHPDEALFAEEALRELRQWQGEVWHVLPTGRRCQVEISVTAYEDGPRGGSTQILVVRDIKDRKLVESVLHESENRYKNLVSVTSDLVWHTNQDAQLTFISPKVVDLLGYSAPSLLNRSLTEFLDQTGDTLPASRSLQQALESSEPFSYLQGTFRAKEGTVKYLEVSGIPHFNAKQKLQGFHGSIRDVTHRVESDRVLRQSLAEKEILIKEIHHRVKNNMQIVSSLLHLQTQFIKDPDMLARLQESQDRIHSMALVHEKLYQSENLALIDFTDYIETLGRHIANSYRTNLIQLQFDFPEEKVFIGIDHAIPSGLIVNELLSNAYKHAFAPGTKGIIKVRLRAEGSTLLLEMEDDGQGLPKTDLTAYESSSLGMQLVDALVHQLRGQLVVENHPGAFFSLSFVC